MFLNKWPQNAAMAILAHEKGGKTESPRQDRHEERKDSGAKPRALSGMMGSGNNFASSFPWGRRGKREQKVPTPESHRFHQKKKKGESPSGADRKMDPADQIPASIRYQIR